MGFRKIYDSPEEETNIIIAIVATNLSWLYSCRGIFTWQTTFELKLQLYNNYSNAQCCGEHHRAHKVDPIDIKSSSNGTMPLPSMIVTGRSTDHIKEQHEYPLGLHFLFLSLLTSALMSSNNRVEKMS